ncbi:hypothetical protein N7447_006407 [Penicillium robsamsonii]|uniref:uncharacterized protein n=1 Tax=Penicillium robsamsonii TaxID=1792511 RepID=UPI0025485A51|nr:uncharacterized protein N7447_006407 [Penicillium robsamsonii]KAJ5824067.1 hypothetical protein N7447_006407 [Penicillium robsamsonii]
MASQSLPPRISDFGIDRISSLPVELLICICSYLANRDIKSLRLACKILAQTARVRLYRVFLSAHPCNIGVFREIADHEAFRHNVTEIIWDDARFIEGPQPHPHPVWEVDEADIDPVEGCPNWFVAECKENIENLNMQRVWKTIYDSDRPNHMTRRKQGIAQPPLKVCWQLYQNLFHQQEDVLLLNSDVDAFIYGVSRFPRLKRVTITPAAHGWLYAPLYETPMIRFFPCGFNYPIPRGWPTSNDGEVPRYAHPWKEATEVRKNQWRAVRKVTSVLAEIKHNVSELVLDVNQLPTGLNCTIFDQPCEEYNNLVQILRSPGFCRLDLTLLVGGQEGIIGNNDKTWISFRSGYLKGALAEAKDMRYISFGTTVTTDTIHDIKENPTHFIPLQTIFPLEEWPKLRSFTLSNFLVKQSDLMDFLAALPKTVCSIELSFLKFLDGNWHSLLTEICDTLCWNQRDNASRPKLIVGTADGMRRAGLGTWLDGELHEFLYGDGPNPFCPEYGDFVDNVGTCRDAFEPEHHWPNVNPLTLVQMGYYRA